jgi:hypothetical protein
MNDKTSIEILQQANARQVKFDGFFLYKKILACFLDY